MESLEKMSEPFNLEEYIFDHIKWSYETFGPGRRTVGLSEHIKKELNEVAENPTDVVEWIDIVILGIDGAWRSIAGDETTLSDERVQNLARIICFEMKVKQNANILRLWPKNTDQSLPTEHIREP